MQEIQETEGSGVIAQHCAGGRSAPHRRNDHCRQQASPHRDVDIEPERFAMPVRDVTVID
jgi:hypothetical protein